jgi:hypothetical protein
MTLLLFGASDSFRVTASQRQDCGQLSFYEVRMLAPRPTPNLECHRVRQSYPSWQTKSRAQPIVTGLRSTKLNAVLETT